MAVLLVDGFDYTGSSAVVLTRGWLVASGAAAITTGRFTGSNGITSSGANNLTLQHLVTSSQTLIAGLAFFTTSVSNNISIMGFGAGSTTLQVNVSTNASNILQIRNSGGTLIATGTTTIVANQWNYIELKGFQNGASGTCELHLNGSTEIASTVGNFGSTNFDRLIIGNGSTSVFRWDDIYVLDTTGSAPRNTFLGDMRIQTVFPTADGTYTNFLPDSGSTHFSRVNESSGTYPDGDTSYVSSATPGDNDTYTFTSLDPTTTILAVQWSGYARKDEATGRQIAPLLRQAGTDYPGTAVALGSSYSYVRQLYNQDPAGSDWTATTFNADEYGVELVA